MTTLINTIAGRAITPRKARLLVVDDNPSALELLTCLLQDEGYHVTRAGNGLEAMNELTNREDDFDVILLDRMMPMMDGMEVTRKILADARTKHIPIIMQTAADRPEQISEGIKAGVFYYLTKPVERRTLLSVVSSAVKEVAQRRVLREEMLRHRLSFGLIQILKGSCRTLEEAESLASFLANCFPDSDRALTGISELLVNGIEHGNLGISFAEKTRLLEKNIWRKEVEKRLRLPENARKFITVLFERKDNIYTLQITDQGEGFNWRAFLEFDPSRATHNHGRGIAMARMISFDRLEYNEKGNQVTAIMQAGANNNLENDND